MPHDPDQPFLADILAAQCKDIGTISGAALDAARRTVLDTLGVAAAGATTEAGAASRRAADDIWRTGNAAVWFSKTRLAPVGAAFVNATYAAALDLDDGNRQASGHPAAAIVPAVIAVGEDVGANARQILTAVTLGYEVAVRIAAARDIRTLRTTDSGLWCGPGVAAAAGWLKGAPATTIADAIAIAAHTSTSQAATGWTRIGHTVKEGIPWATANGLQALTLAAAGHRGPLDILDDPSIYDRRRLIGGFATRWAVEQAYFKLYSCCRWAHAAIDGALILAGRRQIVPETIDGVLVETFERALSLPNQSEPQSLEAAQYSIPFCVALALVHGGSSLLPIENRHVNDPRVTALARRISIQYSPVYRDSFPATTPARVTITAGAWIETMEILLPRGEPGNPLTAGDLQEKFATLSVALPHNARGKLLSAALELGSDGSAVNLYAALSDPT
jgi:2-methylcitrate dehydratase PrpD